MTRARLAVLASGRGSNTQAIIDACAAISPYGALDAEVVVVISNHANAPVIQRASAAGITSISLELLEGEVRHEYDRRLLAEVVRHDPDVVVLAGWMRVLTMSFLGAIGVPVVNIHPALPGELPGTQAIERAFREREIGRHASGVMIHLVPDEGIDDGPVLASVEVPILEADTLETFESRMHEVEHRLLVTTLKRLIGNDRFSTTRE